MFLRNFLNNSVAIFLLFLSKDNSIAVDHFLV